MAKVRLSAGIASCVVAAGLSLGGCAGFADSAPTSSPSALPAFHPVSRVPLSCDELFPEAELEQLLGVEGGLQSPEGVSEFRPYGEYARLAEAGGEHCQWLAPDNGPDFVEVSLAILPDVSTEIRDYEQPVAGAEANVLRDAFGPGSALGCDAALEPPISTCTISVLLAGNFWLDGYVVVPSSVSVTDLAAFVTVLDERLRSADPIKADEFVPPLDSFGLRLDCARITDSAAFKEHPVFGGLDAAQDENRDGPAIFRLAADRVSATDCTWPRSAASEAEWEGPAGLSPLDITVTPGGEWYWDTVADAALHGPGSIHFEKVDVPGTVQALVQGDTGQCEVLALVGHSVVTIATNAFDDSDVQCSTALDALRIVLSADGD